MNDLSVMPQVFDYNGESVRTILRDGEPLFVATDVCAILEIDPSQTRRLDDDEKGLCSVQTPGGLQQMVAVTEAGLYTLVLGSRKPEARSFKRWVTHEVLPMIRCTGAFAASIPRTYTSALRALADQVDANEKLTAEVAALKPKAEVYDMLADAENALPVGAVAKSLHTGRNRLFEFLRDQGLLMRSNLPYQRYLDAGYFRVREVPTTRGEQIVTVTQTMVTPKGQEHIARLWRSEERAV